MDEILSAINTALAHDNPTVRRAATESAGQLTLKLLEALSAHCSDNDSHTATLAGMALDDAWRKLREINSQWEVLTR